jgi:hypothetical protein
MCKGGEGGNVVEEKEKMENFECVQDDREGDSMKRRVGGRDSRGTAEQGAEIIVRAHTG